MKNNDRIFKWAQLIITIIVIVGGFLASWYTLQNKMGLVGYKVDQLTYKFDEVIRSVSTLQSKVAVLESKHNIGEK